MFHCANFSLVTFDKFILVYFHAFLKLLRNSYFELTALETHGIKFKVFIPFCVGGCLNFEDIKLLTTISSAYLLSMLLCVGGFRVSFYKFSLKCMYTYIALKLNFILLYINLIEIFIIDLFIYYSLDVFHIPP